LLEIVVESWTSLVLVEDHDVEPDAVPVIGKNVAKTPLKFADSPPLTPREFTTLFV
jgi:hypothetical protein